MGEVYLYQDTELDRKVAVKFLASYLCRKPDYRQRFKREAQAASKLNYPNIITIHELGEYNDRPFFVMEYVDGQRIDDYVRDETVDIDGKIELAIQICKGLDAARKGNVIHRDIKPSNIMVNRDGLVKILDFGLAKITGKNGITKPGTIMGTIGYMSPEQIKGEEPDYRTDMFSFGAVLYEMLTGNKAFTGKNEHEVNNAILNDNPQPIECYRTPINKKLQSLINKLLAKNRESRYIAILIKIFRNPEKRWGRRGRLPPTTYKQETPIFDQ
jgi:serine/threonine protein kinase